MPIKVNVTKASASAARKSGETLAIVPNPLTVCVGESVNAQAWESNQVLQDGVEWSCEDDSVATCEPGDLGKLKITGKAEGTVTISAKAPNGSTGRAQCTVKPAKTAGDVQQLSLDARIAKLEGERVTLSAEELRVCRKSGLDPEEMLATKRRELAAKASAAAPSGDVSPELARMLRKSGITLDEYRASEAKRAARERA